MGKKKFSRVEKLEDLVPRLREAGLGLHVLPTYHVLIDHADNKTGRCWPSVNRIAEILGICRRTVERHIKALQEAGLVLSNGQGRGRRGRFSSCRYVVVAVLFFTQSTVRHGGRTGSRSPNKERTKPLKTLPPNPPKIDRGDREKDAARRSDGFEWFFA